MASRPRPHLLGIDDGPFEKGRDLATPLVAVLMEGPDLVEGVAVREFPLDGEDLTGFLTDWIQDLRFRPGLQGVVLGGITAAGLAVVDAPALARRLQVPVLVVNRREPRNAPLKAALHAAGLEERIALVEAAPASFPVGDGLHASACGIGPEAATELLRGARGKSTLPEPLRLAHLIATALVRGHSHGRA